MRVLAGVNLPMLLRAVCYRATPLDTLVDKALAGATKGVQAIVPGYAAHRVAPPVVGRVRAGHAARDRSHPQAGLDSQPL